VSARRSSSHWRSNSSETVARARAAGLTALDRRRRSDSQACGLRGRNRRFMPPRVAIGSATRAANGGAAPADTTADRWVPLVSCSSNLK
jgi:hypothetical protein